MKYGAANILLPSTTKPTRWEPMISQITYLIFIFEVDPFAKQLGHLVRTTLLSKCHQLILNIGVSQQGEKNQTHSGCNHNAYDNQNVDDNSLSRQCHTFCPSAASSAGSRITCLRSL